MPPRPKMADRVLIVESPTKARTLGAYLGRSYVVLSSKGHVRDLPERELGVDLEKGFAPKWVVRDRRLVAELRKKTADAEVVYLATDPDREGEAIAFDLMELLGDGHRFARVLLHEITPQAVRQALQEPAQIDLAKVEAQRARRILDRLVGYQISPLLSLVLAGRKYEGLSAGRVQSVALRFVCDRELEIQEFRPEPYWELWAAFPTTPPFRAAFPEKITAQEVLDQLLVDLRSGPFTVKEVREGEVVRRPPAPFITSSLQQTAANELGFSPSRTMRIAQELYEGVEVEGKPVGLITYMRTDSVRVAESAVAEARKLIKRQFGGEFLSRKPRVFKNKNRSQDAHEAIRPTAVERTPQMVRAYLSSEQWKLYDLIWRRFLASQMAEGLWKRTKVVVGRGELELVASSSVCQFPGFTQVLPVGKLEDEDNPLPLGLAPGQVLPVPKLEVEEKKTEPPKRYSEAGLVRKLEEEGVGRPSTYATIVSTIQERGYVVRENGSLHPTLLGFMVTDFLRRYFPQTVEEGFTARLEEDLDRIQEREMDRGRLLDSFYRWFSPQLRQAEEALRRGESRFAVESDVACPTCGAPMLVRLWKGGLYLGCSRYPKCRTTKNLPAHVAFRYRPDRVELKEGLIRAESAPAAPCRKCGAPTVLRHGRYGRYLACPSCGGTQPLSSGVGCPACKEGELVERYSAKRGTFYACSRYPECRFRVAGTPVESCSACEKGVLYEDPRHGVRCSNPRCPSRGTGS